MDDIYINTFTTKAMHTMLTPFNSYMIGAFDAQVFLTNQLDPWEDEYKLDSRVDEMFLEGFTIIWDKNIFCKIFFIFPL